MIGLQYPKYVKVVMVLIIMGADNAMIQTALNVMIGLQNEKYVKVDMVHIMMDAYNVMIQTARNVTGEGPTVMYVNQATVNLWVMQIMQF